MNLKIIIASVLSGAIVLFGAIAFIGIGQDGVPGRDGVGGAAGPDHSFKEFFHAGADVQALSYGGVYATTTTTNSDFTARELCDFGTIVLTPAVAGAKTLNVASSTDMFSRCIPDPGDQHIVFVDHATTTGTNGITWADTGANTDHLEEEGETTVLDVSESAYLKFTNVNDTIMAFEVVILQAAD